MHSICAVQVLTICIKIMDELIPSERASRDFRVKFPDDVIQDNLAGQLWFGAEVIFFNIKSKIIFKTIFFFSPIILLALFRSNLFGTGSNNCLGNNNLYFLKNVTK